MSIPAEMWMTVVFPAGYDPDEELFREPDDFSAPDDPEIATIEDLADAGFYDPEPITFDRWPSASEWTPQMLAPEYGMDNER